MGKIGYQLFFFLPIFRTYAVLLSFLDDGVEDRVVIRSVQIYDLVKTAFWFRLRLRRLRSSENWVVGVGRTKPIDHKAWERECDWVILALVLPTPTISDEVVNGSSRKKMETFWFFWPYPDSVDLNTTPLTTPQEKSPKKRTGTGERGKGSQILFLRSFAFFSSTPPPLLYAPATWACLTLKCYPTIFHNKENKALRSKITLNRDSTEK